MPDIDLQVQQDIEEFFHLNYFVAEPAEVATLVFAGAGSAASSRTRELSRTLQDLGRPFLLLTDDATFDLPEHSLVLPVVAITDSPFSPLVASARVWFEVAEADFGAFRVKEGEGQRAVYGVKVDLVVQRRREHADGGWSRAAFLHFRQVIEPRQSQSDKGASKGQTVRPVGDLGFTGFETLQTR